MAKKFENLPEGVYVTSWNPGDGRRYRVSWQDGGYFAVLPIFTGSYGEVNTFLAGLRAERWRIWNQVWKDDISAALCAAINRLNDAEDDHNAGILEGLLDLLVIDGHADVTVAREEA